MDSAERPAAATSDARSKPGRKSTAIKREKIVRSAAKLFLERGYESVSINEIIAVVGGSKETIYSNFGNKAKLFEAVVQQLCSDVTINIDTRPVGTLEQQTTRIARSFVSIVLTPQIMSFHRLMTSIGREFPEAGRLFYKTGPETVYRIFAEWIAHAAGERHYPRRQGAAPARRSVARHADRRADPELADLGVGREGSRQAHRSDGRTRGLGVPERLRDRTAIEAALRPRPGEAVAIEAAQKKIKPVAHRSLRDVCLSRSNHSALTSIRCVCNE